MMLDRLPAAILNLSTAKRIALTTCFVSKGLRKKDGAWRGEGESSISGVTVADLAREGSLMVNKVHGLAELTERGLRQARVLLCGRKSECAVESQLYNGTSTEASKE
jgi:hypothetical protein